MARGHSAKVGLNSRNRQGSSNQFRTLGTQRSRSSVRLRAGARDFSSPVLDSKWDSLSKCTASRPGVVFWVGGLGVEVMVKALDRVWRCCKIFELNGDELKLSRRVL